MTEIEKLLAQERERAASRKEPPPATGGRRLVALVVGAVAVAALVISGGILGLGASPTLAGTSPTGDATAPGDTLSGPSSVEQVLAPAPSTAPAEKPAKPLPREDLPYGAIALAPGGSPIFDGTNDRSLIPAPPADWSQSEVDNADIWLDQQYIIAQCMAEKGFDYTFIAFYLRTPEDGQYWGEPQSPEFQFALYGDTGGGEDYHWDEAGCDGYAVHVTGMDNAN